MKTFFRFAVLFALTLACHGCVTGPKHQTLKIDGHNGYRTDFFENLLKELSPEFGAICPQVPETTMGFIQAMRENNVEAFFPHHVLADKSETLSQADRNLRSAWDKLERAYATVGCTFHYNWLDADWRN